MMKDVSTFPSMVDAFKITGLTPFFKAMVAFPFVYHYVNGLRHMVSNIPPCKCLYSNIVIVYIVDYILVYKSMEDFPIQLRDRSENLYGFEDVYSISIYSLI